MNAAVVLAAGSSSRMGFPKQLAEVKDKPLLQSIIDKVNNNFDNSSVVLGSESEIISEKIDFKNSNILWVINCLVSLIPEISTKHCLLNIFIAFCNELAEKLSNIMMSGFSFKAAFN